MVQANSSDSGDPPSGGRAGLGRRPDSVSDRSGTKRSADGESRGRVDPDRRRRRAEFLADLEAARELRERVAPRRARVARLRAEIRRRTFLL